MLLLELQKVPEPLVLPAGGLPGPGLGLQLGHPLLVPLQLLGHLLPLKGIGIDALGPGHRRVKAVAEGGDDHPCQVGKGVGDAVEGERKHCRNKSQQQGDHQDQYSVLPQKIFHSSRFLSSIMFGGGFTDR